MLEGSNTQKMMWTVCALVGISLIFHLSDFVNFSPRNQIRIKHLPVDEKMVMSRNIEGAQMDERSATLANMAALSSSADSAISNKYMLMTADTSSTSSPTSTSVRPRSALDTKVIYQPTGGNAQTLEFNKKFEREMKFDRCNYSNCVFKHSRDMTDTAKADIVLLEYSSPVLSRVTQADNSLQQWIVYSHEAPSFYRWKPVTDQFDATMTYERKSAIYWPWGEMIPVSTRVNVSKDINYAEGKSKGAYAYVSHCDSKGYNRLDTMKQLNKYIDVDIFGGCTHNIPCKRGDIVCETALHTKYKFFLAFENSLCRDYITEKFWRRLGSQSYFIPVALGGLSVDEYTAIAPPDSFIHAYNFSSIDQLGQYLRHLMEDDAAYNRYHQWRDSYYTTDNVLPQSSICTLCELANKPTILKSQHRLFAEEWNDSSNCRKF